ncbi:hypothetical protein MSIMFB_00625 [Mycobacterium simulans]|uniref:Uncharacterized protein n=1 Tax=Mycobacterium simulans TaxID=627089 RepID=A0A7Z7N8U3_9MYCO|nr:hypothetical protein MSIMFB_00625 [Mycobacterium simulans]
MLLAYYIAAVNIASTYHALTGKTAETDVYEPFTGIALADTFQISEAGDSMDAIMFPRNNERIQRQLHTPISVIVGNPSYSVGQTSANDLNANVKYPTLDGRIENTYAKRSTATNENSLYDSYIRAFRWATDRIGASGVVGFVSNGGYIDGNTADGMRLSLTCGGTNAQPARSHARKVARSLGVEAATRWPFSSVSRTRTTSDNARSSTATSATT